MHPNNSSKSFILSFILLFLFSCASKEVNLYKSLQISKVSYEALYEEIIEREPDLTTNQLIRLNELRTAWLRSHNMANEAIRQYKLTKQERNYQTAMRLIMESDRLYNQIIEVINSLEVLQ